MMRIVTEIPGFISINSFTGEDGHTIELIRFESEEALNTWRNHAEHLKNQRRGRESFYEFYSIEVCKVIRQYDFHRGTGRRTLIPAPAAS